MARSKLKSALDNEKGRNIKLELQRKHEKEVHKRKEKNNPEAEDDDSAEEGGVQLGDAAEPKVNGKSKKDKANGVKAAAAKDEPEWESDGSEGEDASDDDDDMPQRPVLDLSHLDDSESDVSGDDEEPEALGIHADEEDDEDEDQDEDQDAEEEEDDDDIPFSDIESLASDDRGDIIPHQRLTINNTVALTAAVKRIQLPYSKLAFSEHMAVVTDEPVDIPDVEDDLNRELAFYKQSLSAVNDARAKLKKEGAPFSRPADYFAEMVKSDEHMGKIKKKLVDDAAGKKASAEARKQRDLKKFGKQVQVAKAQERAKEKKDTIEKINLLKRSMSNPSPTQPQIQMNRTNSIDQNAPAPTSKLPPKKTSSISSSTTQTRKSQKTAGKAVAAAAAARVRATPSGPRRTRNMALAAKRGMRRATMRYRVRMERGSRSRR